jgi:hypothetical protein
MQIILSKDFLAGLAAFGIGAAVVWGGSDYTFGTPRRMGPGFFPVVLGSALNIGMGDVLDEERGNAMPAGSFVVMPKGHNHFAWTEQETVVQLHSTGPWGITYVNPADDPRGSN